MIISGILIIIIIDDILYYIKISKILSVFKKVSFIILISYYLSEFAVDDLDSYRENNL